MEVSSRSKRKNIRKVVIQIRLYYLLYALYYTSHLYKNKVFRILLFTLKFYIID